MLKQREKNDATCRLKKRDRRSKPSAAAAASSPPTPAICGRSCKKMTDEPEDVRSLDFNAGKVRR